MRGSWFGAGLLAVGGSGFLVAGASLLFDIRGAARCMAIVERNRIFDQRKRGKHGRDDEYLVAHALYWRVSGAMLAVIGLGGLSGAFWSVTNLDLVILKWIGVGLFFATALGVIAAFYGLQWNRPDIESEPASGHGPGEEQV